MTIPAPPIARAVVWGGLGFIGQHVVSGLLEQGAEVCVLCRSRRQYVPPAWAGRVRWLELDGRRNRAVVMREAAEWGVVFDLAGASGTVSSNLNPQESLRENCEEHLRFFQACEQARRPPHIIFASSWLVYGRMQQQPVDERQALEPRSLYAAHKACIESYLRIYALRGKLSYTVCRISNPYGPYRCKPRRTYNILNLFIEQSLSGKPVFLFGDGRQLRDYLYIDDLVEGLLLCATVPAARNELFNISLGRSHSILEAVEMIRAMVAAPPPVFVPWEAEYEAVESGSYVADIGKARELLGLQPRIGLRRGLEATVGHMRGMRAAGD